MDKGYLWPQTSLSILHLSFTLAPALSYPLRQPWSLPVSVKPELAQKVQVANDLPPYISIESYIPGAFVECQAVLIK